MENEIMVNEEIVESTAEEIAEGTSGKGWLIAAAIGATVVVGIGVYKFVKKVNANIKAKKEAKAMLECDEYEEVTEEISEEA